MGLYRKADGSLVTVPDDQAVNAPGLTPVNADEAGAPVESPESGGLIGGIGSFASGGLSGITLGASDYALKGLLNRGDFARLAADREGHPIANVAGNLVGTVAAAGAGSLAAATPAGLLSRGSLGLTEELGGGLAAKLVGAGVEGAGQSAGMYISDAALGDRDLTAEGMAGSLGMGFAFGVGGGAVAHGIEAGTIAARRMFARVAEGGEQAAKDAEAAWARQSEEAFATGDQVAEAARTKLQAAKTARMQAGLVRDQAAASAAEARVAAPGLDVAAAQARGLDANIGKVEALPAQAPIAGNDLDALNRATEQLKSVPSTGPISVRQQLADLGYSPDEIAGMSPGIAHEVAAARVPPGPAITEEVHLVSALAEHDAAKAELDDILQKLEGADTLLADDPGFVATGEFGKLKPGEHDWFRDKANGIKSPRPEPIIDIPEAANELPRGFGKGTPQAKSLGEIAAEQSPVGSPTEAVSASGVGFEKTSRPAGGSQGGAWYADSSGQQWFGKSYAGNTDRIENEHLANSLYRMFGVSAPETGIAEVGGKRMMMSRELPGTVSTSAEGVAATDAKNGFIVDAWLGNHDVIGTGYDNILTSGGKAHRIDNGGATIFRAQGEPKEFRAPVSEIETMRDPNRHSGKAFAGLTDSDVQQQMRSFVENYKANAPKIAQMVDESGLSAGAKSKIKEGLRSRAEWIEAQVTKPEPLSHDEFDAFTKEVHAKLSPATTEAMLAYSRNGLYAQLNGPMRADFGKLGGGGLRSVSKELRDTVAKIDEGMAASPAPRDMIVVRGVNGKRSLEQAMKLEVGDSYIDPGFISTSYDPEVGRGFAEGFGVRKGVEIQISVPKGYPASPIPSELPKEREILLGRGGRLTVTGVDKAEDGGRVIHMTLSTPEAAAAPHPVPGGFSLDAPGPDGRPMFTEPDIATGIPKYSDIPNGDRAQKVAYVVRPSELAGVGVRGQPVEAGVIGENMPAIEVSIHPGPVVDGVKSTGGYSVAFGGDVLMAAARDGDRPVLVKFWPKASKLKADLPSLSESITSSIPKVESIQPARAAVSAAATDSLTGLLRGTQEKLAAGEGLNSIGAPARAEYAATKAAKTSEAAEYFRAKAAGDRTTTFDIKDTNLRFDAKKRAYVDPSGAAMSIPPSGDMRLGLSPRVEPVDQTTMRKLEMAHDAAVERAAVAVDPAVRREATAEARKIEQQMTASGKRPGAVEDVAAAAPAIDRYEKATAALTEAVGDAAPPGAHDAAKAYRDAEAAAERKTMERTTRAVDAHAETQPDLSPVGRDRRPSAAPSGKAAIAQAKAVKLQADAAFARARAAETEAGLGARAADQAAKDLRASAPAAPSAVPVQTAGGALMDKVGAVVKVIGVAGELGVPGVPHPKDIPVIGKLLDAYVKYRMLKATAGRFVGRIPATAEAKAAALAARTKDKIATAVDRSLGLIERNAPVVRSAGVAASAQVATALRRRAIDDGHPDAPKDATPQQVAAVRIREVAAVATNPQLILAKIREETKGISDPDLIAAIEKHQVAVYQHLNDTAPKAPPPNPYSKREWEPSAAAALQWGRRYAVANDPAVAFEALHQQSLTPEAADSLRVCSPKLFAMAQQRLVSRAANITEPVEYSQRLRCSLLFQVPLDASLEPDNAAVLRSAYKPLAPTPAPGGPPGAPPIPSIAGPTNLTSLYQPASDRRSAPR